MNETNWIPVYSAQGKLSAEIIRLLLESFQIPATLSQESVGSTYGLTVGDLGEVDILVPAAKVDEAVEILRAMEAGKFEEGSPSEENNDRIDFDNDSSED
jgi:hypothetical protein